VTPRIVTPRLVASDLDGTLLRADHTLSRRTATVLERLAADGVHIVLATGRPQRTLNQLYRQLSIRPLAVCANGAAVYDPTTDVFLNTTYLSPALLSESCARIRAQVPDVVFGVELDGGRRMLRERGFRVDREEWLLDVGEADLAELVQRPAAKLVVKPRDTGVPVADVELTRLLTEAVSDSLDGIAEATYSSDWVMAEVSAIGVSKASGLAWVAEHYAVKADDVIAFGDMPNDIPMFAWAGSSVAVANAHPETRGAADTVTHSNDEDGVADHLERLYGLREPVRH
jgi:hydroxymethylpyrimidine pyrophosphatase-like HAD family hydrolase